MNLFADICPLFNVSIATFPIAQLRYVAWQQLLKAASTAAATVSSSSAAAAAAAVVDKDNELEERVDEDHQKNNEHRIRTILASFQNGTAPASAEQELLLELKECLTSSNNSNKTTNQNHKMLGGPTGADLQRAVTALLLPQTMTQLLTSVQWYSRESKEFRSLLQRTGGVNFHEGLLEMKNVGAEEEDTADAAGAAAASSSAASSASTMLLVACNHYRVDTGPSGKELMYFIFLDQSQERIIVTFRGSLTLSDWAHDVRVNVQSINNPFYSCSSSSEPASTNSSHDSAQDQERPGDRRGGGGGHGSRTSSLLQERQLETIHVHSGFYRYLCVATTGEESKLDQILRKLYDLLKEHPTYKVVVTGHSLGGAVSTLFAFMAAAAAASSTEMPEDNNKHDDKDTIENKGDRKDLSERVRMWLPTPNKVARLFGGSAATAASSAAAAEEPPSVTYEINNTDDDADKPANEEETSRTENEESYFHIGLPTPITVVSFGSPTVGDDAFCRSFGLLEERGVLRHLRIANEDDIVPSIPVTSIPTTLERVYLYKHTGIPLLQHSQTIPMKQLFRWFTRKMNKQNQNDDDTGAALFRIAHGDRQKMMMKNNVNRNDNNINNATNSSDWNITENVAVVAQDFANAVGGLHLRTPIPHLPTSYHKRLHRIEVYLRRLSLDQLYQEYLDFDNTNDDVRKNDDGNGNDKATGTSGIW